MKNLKSPQDVYKSLKDQIAAYATNPKSIIAMAKLARKNLRKHFAS